MLTDHVDFLYLLEITVLCVALKRRSIFRSFRYRNLSLLRSEFRHQKMKTLRNSLTFLSHLSAYLHMWRHGLRKVWSINSAILVHSKTNSEEMAFFSDQFLRDVLFFAVGGVSSVAILKIWENRESLLREIRRRFDSNETRQPEEHDERFDWEGKNSVSYENILSKSDRLIVISENLYDTRRQWLLRQRQGKCFIIFLLLQQFTAKFGKWRDEVKQQSDAGSRAFFSRSTLGE